MTHVHVLAHACTYTVKLEASYIQFTIIMLSQLIFSVCYDYRDIARGKERVPIPVTNDVDSTNYPTDFVYVTESVWTSPVPINTTISSLQVPVICSLGLLHLV